MQNGRYLISRHNEEQLYLTLASRPRPSGSASSYRGVSKTTSGLPWRANLKHKGRRYYLGVYATEIEAAMAYDRAALQIVGPHAITNGLVTS